METKHTRSALANSGTSQDYFGGEVNIDAKDLILTIVRYLPGALVGAVAGIVLALLLVALLPKRYQTSALLEVSPAPLRQVMQPLEGLGGQLVAQDPALTQNKGFAKSYETMVAATNVFVLVKKNIQAKGASLEGASFEAKIIPLTQLLELRVIAPKPENAIVATNAWADSIIEAFSNQGAELFQRSQSFLSGQYQKSKGEIDTLEAKINAIQARLEVKEVELNAKKPQLLSGIKELVEIEPQIDSLKITLPVYKEEIKKHDKVIPASSRSDAGTASSPNYTVNLTPSGGGGEVKFVAYGANPIYMDLERKISEGDMKLATLVPRKEQLHRLLGSLKKEVDDLQEFVDAKNLEKNQAERALGIAKKSYDLVYGKMSDAEFASTLRLANLRVIGYAADASLINRRTQFMLGGGASGFFLGFLLMYWLALSGQSAKPSLRLNPTFTRPEVTEVR